MLYFDGLEINSCFRLLGMAVQREGELITWFSAILQPGIRRWAAVHKYDHNNVHMVDLCKAWSYRDQTQPVYFRMTRRVRLSSYGYRFLVFVTTPLWAFGIILWLNSFGTHSYQLRLLGAVIGIPSLFVFILNVIFNYGGHAAFLICKKTESRSKQENDSGE
jgi:hypothetical protein